jgi:hypothetical protein
MPLKTQGQIRFGWRFDLGCVSVWLLMFALMLLSCTCKSSGGFIFLLLEIRL